MRRWAELKGANVEEDNEIAVAVRKLAVAVTADAAAGKDAFGGHVASLTEAVMGITTGLARIAGALESVAQAIADRDV
jgi:hypothetical protein